jgi:hypothetical protein
MQSFGPVKIEEGFIDRDGFNKRRQFEHQGSDLPRHASIFCHIGPHHDSLRAGCQRFEHGHGGANAEGPGDIAAGRNDASFAAANDERFVTQARVIPLLDRGVKSIAIDMCNRELIELGMREEAWRAASYAATVA